jgi:hypothetical protein
MSSLPVTLTSHRCEARAVRHGTVNGAGSTHGHVMWNWRRVKVEETTDAVKEVGAQNFLLATDLGQTGNPSPADGPQLFVTDLMGAGLSKDQIMTMP